MGIVSEPGGRGKGFVTTGRGGASPEQGWTRGRWERPDPPEGGERPEGRLWRCPAWGVAAPPAGRRPPRAIGPAGARDTDEVHPDQPQHQGGHGLGRRRSLPWQRGEELSGGSGVCQVCQGARDAERLRSKARRNPAIPSADAGLSQVQQGVSGDCSHQELDILGNDYMFGGYA